MYKKNYSIVDSIISRLYEMCGGIEIKDDDHFRVIP